MAKGKQFWAFEFRPGYFDLASDTAVGKRHVFCSRRERNAWLRSKHEEGHTKIHKITAKEARSVFYRASSAVDHGWGQQKLLEAKRG